MHLSLVCWHVSGERNSWLHFHVYCPDMYLNMEIVPFIILAVPTHLENRNSSLISPWRADTYNYGWKETVPFLHQCKVPDSCPEKTNNPFNLSFLAMRAWRKGIVPLIYLVLLTSVWGKGIVPLIYPYFADACPGKRNSPFNLSLFC